MLNGQRVTITRKHFPWSISSKQPNELRCTFMGYEQIRAMKLACTRVGIGETGVQALFHDNAHTLIHNAANSIVESRPA